MDKTQIFKNAGLALSKKEMFVRNGSGVSFRGKLIPSLLPGVKQTKPDHQTPNFRYRGYCSRDRLKVGRLTCSHKEKFGQRFISMDFPAHCR